MSRKKAYYLIGIALGLCFSSYCCAAESSTSAFLFTEDDGAKVTTYFLEEDYEAIVRMVPRPCDFHEDAQKGDCFDEIIMEKFIACMMLDDPASALEIVDYQLADLETHYPDSKDGIMMLLFNQGILHCLCDNYGLAIDSFQKAVKLKPDIEISYTIHQQLAYLYAYTKKYDKVREELKILESLYPAFVIEMQKLVKGVSVNSAQPFRVSQSQLIEYLEQPDKKQIQRLRIPQRPPVITKEGGIVFNAGVFWDNIDMFEIENSEKSK
ncbi:MAG: hypothetical protein ACRC2T_08560 [Thermoguttaceae bacterium]